MLAGPPVQMTEKGEFTEIKSRLPSHPFHLQPPSNLPSPPTPTPHVYFGYHMSFNWLQTESIRIHWGSITTQSIHWGGVTVRTMHSFWSNFTTRRGSAIITSFIRSYLATRTGIISPCTEGTREGGTDKTPWQKVCCFYILFALNRNQLWTVSTDASSSHVFEITSN